VPSEVLFKVKSFYVATNLQNKLMAKWTTSKPTQVSEQNFALDCSLSFFFFSVTTCT